ncbi:putative glycolipid-binding domain-containing protein [Haloprofundus salilacus]|uniref:putative glycolipid-binding domain-containing protein n=1 Tax=Haloprofundus salilacus TaxID=2876190 RepID=UPI001CCADE2B|nr:putative glycolipid-binding domain-containing protein [Haloprofundus salilacus]
MHDVLWEPADAAGLEHLRYETRPLSAESVVLGVRDGERFRIRYALDCDAEGRVRSVSVDSFDDGASLRLLTDGEGRWTDDDGAPIPELDGCLDVDISATPFTNSLPIRRLDLAAGESATLSMAYVSVPALEVSAVRQKYICLDPLDADGGRFCYEGLTSGFSAEIPVDSEGVVRDYPGLFRRVDRVGLSRTGND